MLEKISDRQLALCAIALGAIGAVCGLISAVILLFLMLSN